VGVLFVKHSNNNKKLTNKQVNNKQTKKTKKQTKKNKIIKK
jgi:hypothetical protein